MLGNCIHSNHSCIVFRNGAITYNQYAHRIMLLLLCVGFPLSNSWLEAVLTSTEIELCSREQLGRKLSVMASNYPKRPETRKASITRNGFHFEGFRISLLMSFLVTVSLFKVTMQEGELVMTLNSFQNSDNKKHNGDYCDSWSWWRCDPYFIICVTDFRSPTSASSCPLMKTQTKSWSDTGNVDFNSRRLTAKFSIWKGFFGLHIAAMDEDTFGSELIDSFTTTVNISAPANGTFSLERSLQLHGKQSSFKFKVKVRCSMYYFGADCGEYCRANGTGLQSHYSCSTNGTRICHKNWYGSYCRTYCLEQNGTIGYYRCNMSDGGKICHKNWFGQECRFYCLAQNGTNGHYRCNSTNGSRICHKNWYGPNCTTYCIPNDDADGHYRCDSLTGSKVCMENWHSANCTVYCRERNDTFANYKCDPATGRKICRFGWHNENCTNHCVPRNDSFGVYTCDKRNGDRICGSGWFGVQCSTYCVPRNDTLGHFECDKENGTKRCRESWFGENCTKYCMPKNDTVGHYFCDASTGQKICHMGWFGSGCNVLCVQNSDPKGTFNCHNGTGEKICHKGWHGVDCNTFCMPRNDSHGHYNCDEKNGSKVCHQNWYGLNCTLRTGALASIEYNSKFSLASFSGTSFVLQPGNTQSKVLERYSSDLLITPQITTTVASMITTLHSMTASQHQNALSNTIESLHMSHIPNTASSSIYETPSAGSLQLQNSTSLPELLTQLSSEKAVSLQPASPLSSLPRIVISRSSVLHPSPSQLTTSISQNATRLELQETSFMSFSFKHPSSKEVSSAKSLSLMRTPMSRATTQLASSSSSILRHSSSISIKTPQQIPKTTAKATEITKKTEKSSASWLTSTSSGIATLSVVAFLLVISTLAIILFTLRRRLLKNNGYPKTTRWEDYVDTLTEVKNEDGVSNPVDGDEGCFLGENPVYGLVHNNGSVNHGGKSNNPSSIRIEHNEERGESAV